MRKEKPASLAKKLFFSDEFKHITQLVDIDKINVLKQNGTLSEKVDIFKLTCGSSRYKIPFKCKINPKHVWENFICETILNVSLCPYCDRKKVCEDNCLLATHPDLCKEWDYDRNSLSPEKILSGSNQKVFWKCSINPEHQWKTTVVLRTQQKTGCPFCKGQKVCFENSLLNKEPEISKQFNVELNKITPDKILYNNQNKIYHWTCIFNSEHTWKTTPYIRITSQRYCPFCFGKKVSRETSLEYKFPELLLEWNYDLNSIKPSQIKPGSGVSVWWKCKTNEKHIWKTSVCLRTRKEKNGCPYCRKSKGELKIIEILDKHGFKYETEKTFENCFYIRKLRFDFAIYIQEQIKVIEFQGAQHFNESYFNIKKNTFDYQKERDAIKRKYCSDNNIPLLEIPFWEISNIEKIILDFLN